MPRGRYQQKQWDAREDAILEALEELSAARGFANITMDDVADEVGISKATLYQHFASKDAMLTRLLAHHTERFLAWVESTADQSPVARLRQTMQFLMTEHIAPFRGMIRIRREDVVPVFENDADLVRQHDTLLGKLGEIVREGQARGEIAPDLEPAAVISAMWALSHVSLGGGRALEHHAAALSPERFARQMIALFERSIRPV